jgi:hypothetical protein
MSHNISEIDRQEADHMGWHGKTDVKTLGALVKNLWLATWDVMRAPMFTKNKNGEHVVDDYSKIVASDNPDLVIVEKPVHKDSFFLLTNAAFLAIVQDALNVINSISPGAVIASAGSVCRRTRTFVSIRLPDMPLFKAAGRTFKPYLTFLNSFDLSAPFVIVVDFTCVVCENTFRMVLHVTDGMREGIAAARKRDNLCVVIKHTRNMPGKLANVPEILQAFLGTVALFKARIEKLAKTALPKEDVNALFTGFLNQDISEGMKSLLLNGKLDAEQKKNLQIGTRRQKQIDRLIYLFSEGKGNKGENLADAFSAFTDYYSHESAGGDKNPDKQIASSEFGDGQVKKDAAMETLLNSEEVDKLIVMGRKLITIQEAK